MEVRREKSRFKKIYGFLFDLGLFSWIVAMDFKTRTDDLTINFLLVSLRTSRDLFFPVTTDHKP